MKVAKGITISTLLFLAMACSPIPDGTNAPSPSDSEIDSHTSSEDSLLLSDETGLSGSGRLLFTTPLLSTSSRENYVLHFKSLKSENTHLILMSHGTDFYSEDGFEIHIKVLDDQWQIQLLPPGVPNTHWQPIAKYSKDQSLKLSIDVHNDSPTSTRVIIWNLYEKQNGRSRTPLQSFSLETSIFDSNNDEGPSIGRGKSMKWGLFFEFALIIEAHRRRAILP